MSGTGLQRCLSGAGGETRNITEGGKRGRAGKVFKGGEVQELVVGWGSVVGLGRVWAEDHQADIIRA